MAKNKYANGEFTEGLTDPEQSREHLEYLLDDSDSGEPSDNNISKYNKSWWQELIQELESILISGLISDDEVISAIVIFIEQYTTDDFRKNRNIDETDIAKADDIIKNVYRYIDYNREKV